MKEPTIEDYIAEENEYKEYGKGCVETAYNLPADYFSDKENIADVEDVASDVDIVENSITQETKHAVELLVINTLDMKDAMVCCLAFGLIDGKQRTLDTCASLLDISPKSAYNSAKRGICKLRHSSEVVEVLMKDEAIDKSNLIFKDYGEFLKNYILHEHDHYVRNDLTEIFQNYLQSQATEVTK